jgi:hypothetical protein
MTRLIPILDPLRPGYADAEAASILPLDSALWKTYVRDVVGMPVWTIPAVQIAVRMRAWKRAGDPLKSIREASSRAVRRMELKESGSAPKVSKKTICPE